jgi:excisionase family DNA binding protein
MMEMTHYRTIDEACRALRISKSKLYHLHRAGKITMHKFGRTTLIPQQSIDDVLEEIAKTVREPVSETK